MNIFTILLKQPLANGLILFYRLLGNNMGLAIIGFSIFLVIILAPLTKPYMESMKNMRKYQVDLARLKKKHKGDKVKYAQAQADFYKEKGINPSKGCLPYILQFAILIAFFRVFMTVFNGDSIVQSFNTLLYAPLRFAEDAAINTRFLYVDVAKPDVLHVSAIPFGIPGPILILSALVQLISAKITQPFIEEEKKLAKKTPGEADDIMASTQAYMIYMFPLFTLWFGAQFPSGLALYWLVFSGNQAVRQYRSSGWGGATPWARKLMKKVS
jgi:YidC/Oxa1 family membrane protein insertase